MLLTITNPHQAATDLGNLLRKHLAKIHVFQQSFGQAHVFSPEATEQATNKNSPSSKEIKR